MTINLKDNILDTVGIEVVGTAEYFLANLDTLKP
jgi:hypothetical protein